MLGLHTINTKRYNADTDTDQTIPVVSVSLTVVLFFMALLRVSIAKMCGSIPQFFTIQNFRINIVVTDN